jgi:non-ribosomal peptide synthetase component F
MTFFQTKTQLFLIFTMLYLIIFQWMCSCVIFIKLTQQVNLYRMTKLHSVILIVNIEKFHFFSYFIDSLVCLDAVTEQQIPMTVASVFWLETLHDIDLDQSLTLPFDRYRLSNEHRTDRGITVSFDFGTDLSHYLLAYASSKNITPSHVALASYYAFLFKLTNRDRDICIGMNTHDRYKDELKSVIGLFENIIPLRCQLNPHWSFHQLLIHVQEILTNSLEYSYFPLQRILNQHPNVSKPAFLGISFEFQSNENEVMNRDGQLCLVPIPIKTSEGEIISKDDFTLIIHHNLSTDQLSCTINASLDLFHVNTIDKIVQRFHIMLEQLFTSSDDQIKRPIYDLSLILSDEQQLMASMNNTQVSFPSTTCIHHEFAAQVINHPQKLAVELDEQSLTYAELLYYVQWLCLTLLNDIGMNAGDIICQCVEQSLSMVSE